MNIVKHKVSLEPLFSYVQWYNTKRMPMTSPEEPHLLMGYNHLSPEHPQSRFLICVQLTDP